MITLATGLLLAAWLIWYFDRKVRQYRQGEAQAGFDKNLVEIENDSWMYEYIDLCKRLKPDDYV